MKNILIFLMITFTIFSVSCKSKSEKSMDSQYFTDTAYEYFNSLLEESYDKAYTNFPHDRKMKELLSEEKYREFFVELREKSGDFVEFSGDSYSKKGDYNIVTIGTIFENNSFNTNIVFDKEGSIAGFNFSPYTFGADEIPEGIIEKDIEFGEKDFILKGKLSLPEGDGPFPCIILVHGSGPNDMDETVGSNKPFRDRAHSLAEKGVAVFRYNKRTFTYNNEFMDKTDFTVKEEVIDDAVLALEKISGENIIQKDRIFILGHSLGGYLIPRIAERTTDAAGYIMAAANARPLQELAPYQFKYLMDNTHDLSEDEIDYFEKSLKELEKLKNLGSLKKDEMILGAYKAYWQDLKNYNPVEMINKINKPVMILQGERDYQVTMEDFSLWKKAVEGKNNFVLESYPGLNHLLMYGEQKSLPAEYFIKGHVDKKLIEDIADFINGRE